MIKVNGITHLYIKSNKGNATLHHTKLAVTRRGHMRTCLASFLNVFCCAYQDGTSWVHF